MKCKLSSVLQHEWLFNSLDVVDGRLQAAVGLVSATSDLPVSGMDQILQEQAETLGINYCHQYVSINKIFTA